MWLLERSSGRISWRNIRGPTASGTFHCSSNLGMCSQGIDLGLIPATDRNCKVIDAVTVTQQKLFLAVCLLLSKPESASSSQCFQILLKPCLPFRRAVPPLTSPAEPAPGATANRQDLGHSRALIQKQHLHEENIVEGSKNSCLDSCSPVGTNHAPQLNATANQVQKVDGESNSHHSPSEHWCFSSNYNSHAFSARHVL